MSTLEATGDEGCRLSRMEQGWASQQGLLIGEGFAGWPPNSSASDLFSQDAKMSSDSPRCCALAGCIGPTEARKPESRMVAVPTVREDGS